VAGGYFKYVSQGKGPSPWSFTTPLSARASSHVEACVQ
jgi:hypothetical protein